MFESRPTKLNLAQLPTEFRPLDRVSAELGGPRIWLKSDDQTGSLLSGNKIRKLDYLLADAKRQGADTVITCGGMQSNHCRATSAAAARLGLRCHLILRGPQSLKYVGSKEFTLAELALPSLEGNVLLDAVLGASISVYSPSYYAENLQRIFDEVEQRYAELGRSCYAIPTGGSNALGLWGYIDAAQELADDFLREGIEPSAVICATGSAGTQGGLSLGFYLLNHECSVIGVAVCDSADYFYQKIRQDLGVWQAQYPGAHDSVGSIADALRINTLEQYIGPGYGLGYPALFDAIAWLARTEGVVLDPVYTGKAFYGMVSEIKNGTFKGCEHIVFVHTGGVYGLFPYENKFPAASLP
ncbi:MAG: D-cysteine desulfhydrase [Lentisphaeria bacterium]|jgi:D-cysteine desulfhydrase